MQEARFTLVVNVLMMYIRSEGFGNPNFLSKFIYIICGFSSTVNKSTTKTIFCSFT